ncbi:MAG TPA: L-fucose mutarotase [Sphingobacteriaceae bacterium]|nr:L-fucose mutarotase [Sphingobacteriaceae bacterium]
MKRFCLALDLKDNANLIAEYEYWHKNMWPEIIESIKSAEIENMQLYRYSNRLFMIMEVTDEFSFDKKNASDSSNEKVQEWENFVWKFQQAMPGAKPGEKWVLMDKIFDLKEY